MFKTCVVDDGCMVTLTVEPPLFVDMASSYAEARSAVPWMNALTRQQ